MMTHCSGDDLSSLCIVWQIKGNSLSSSVHLFWRGCCQYWCWYCIFSTCSFVRCVKIFRLVLVSEADLITLWCLFHSDCFSSTLSTSLCNPISLLELGQIFCHSSGCSTGCDVPTGHLSSTPTIISTVQGNEKVAAKSVLQTPCQSRSPVLLHVSLHLIYHYLVRYI